MRLVLNDAHFGVGILLELIVVTVQMVGGNVQQDGDVCTEIVHIVELETAKFNHVVVVWLFSNLQGEALADVSCQSNVVSSIFEYMVDEACSSGLTVATCNTNHFGIGVSACKFYFADDVRALFDKLFHYRSFLRNARTFYDFVGI